VELLKTAKFPVILAGGGVVMGDAVEEARQLAERLGAPVATGYLRNDAFPAKHPLWAGPLGYQGSKAAMKLIAQADVVIALGSRMGSAPCPSMAWTTGPRPPRSSRSRPITPIWAWSRRSPWASTAMPRP
jgi:thiamine pyrophosphate-dependent acetolactate synthase large subunit-like protein